MKKLTILIFAILLMAIIPGLVSAQFPYSLPATHNYTVEKDSFQILGNNAADTGAATVIGNCATLSLLYRVKGLHASDSAVTTITAQVSNVDVADTAFIDWKAIGTAMLCSTSTVGTTWKTWLLPPDSTFLKYPIGFSRLRFITLQRNTDDDTAVVVWYLNKRE